MLRLLLIVAVALLACFPSVAPACDHAQFQAFVAQPYAVQAFVQPYAAYQVQAFAQPVYAQQFVQQYAVPQQVFVQQHHAQAVVVRERLGFRERRAIRLQNRADRAAVRSGLRAGVRQRVIVVH